ncbi:MAG: hypothetical protein IIW08_11290 [Clostridia bacterium]|nr:hypothetical protein [Clostridia bacterium]MBQ5771742.1 hypothetical protein [Clostridia bacterium]
MKKKTVFYSEIAYIVGMITLAVGTAFMERADFGISMVVAPAYLIHLKVSQTLPFYTFGMSEYIFQAFLLILLSVVMRRFKKSYLFSFVTAVLYGITLDLTMSLVSLLPFSGMWARVVYYVLGMALCSVGVAFFFKTYISPEAYELFVRDISDKYSAGITKVKTVYDVVSCLIGVIMSFIFFGLWHFEGVKAGTILCALINGFMIGKISAYLDKTFDFKDALKLRKLFEK